MLQWLWLLGGVATALAALWAVVRRCRHEPIWEDGRLVCLVCRAVLSRRIREL